MSGRRRGRRYVPAEFVLGEHPQRVARPTSGDGPALWMVDAGRQGERGVRLAPTVLDAAERQRAAAFRRRADHRSYAVAHVALRLLLGACLGVAPHRVRLVREPCPRCGGPHGRPAAEGDRGVHFSLSHSDDLVLLAFAAVPVGVDVQRGPRYAAVADARSALHPAEVRELAALPEAERPAAFARAWVRKEAYLKGIGTGLARSPSLDYVGTGPDPADGPPGWRVSDVVVPEDFTAAVAVRRSP
ncbi:4'-phosphopantetheinyl transferase family protein [Streptomyces sp. NPDC093546]|uniref:4'-phosphopantetheinyl transferase family protein n=1 Tax=Streptomyces sp. NPDC093546 TaxID=3366040 RepID=UPI00380A8DA0